LPQPSVPAPSVLAGLRQALKPHAPFSAMSEGDLERIVRASRLRYFAPGETILAPAADRPAHCYVIRQGTVRGERPDDSGGAAALWELSAGEMFPLGALLGRRGVTSVYRATQDTFCLAFPAAAFDTLYERVVPGDPDASIVYQRLVPSLCTGTCKTMPLDRPTLSEGEVARIRQWIIDGAPED